MVIKFLKIHDPEQTNRLHLRDYHASISRRHMKIITEKPTQHIINWQSLSYPKYSENCKMNRV